MVRRIKAYITCPISYTQERLKLLPDIKSVVDSKGIESFVFVVGGTSDEIFKRDYDQLSSADIIIAEVSERSHGVGIEIGMSFCLGLRRILLIQKGRTVTKLAQGMPNTTIIEYINSKDLIKKLDLELENIRFRLNL